MAQLHHLTPAELAARAQQQGPRRRGRRPERTRLLEAFKTVLQQAEPGYGGEVVLAAGENKRVVRPLLKVAAAALGYALDFRPTKDPTRIYFRVITPEERAAHPKPGGRPRKRAA